VALREAVARAEKGQIAANEQHQFKEAAKPSLASTAKQLAMAIS